MTPAYDIVVFGASGFTGKRVLKYLVTSGQTEVKPGRVAAAGRSRNALEKILRDLGLASIDIIVANVDDPESLQKMAKQARVVLNCVGPYRYWGEAVVKACLSARTDYLDITGEPDFIERMEFKYSEAARAAGSYVVSAVGFDSVPADLGCLFTQRLFQPPSVPVSVESFLTLKPGKAGMAGNYATWESAVMGFGAVDDLKALRQQIRAAGKAPAPPIIAGPRPRKVEGFAWDSRMNAYIVPFPGSDASIVRRTQASLSARGEAAVHFSAYFTVANTIYLLILAFFGTLMQMLAKSAFGRSLLLTYPGIFSAGAFRRGGPTQAMIETTTFSMTFIANGYSKGEPSTQGAKPDRTVVTRMTGPEPGYVATPIFMAEAARTLLAERSTLPTPGVYTAATVFGNTSYVDRLRKAGIQLEVLSDKASAAS